MTARRKVLVLGNDTRSFLATVRSLGRAGLDVHAAPFGFRSPALRSRYISHIHWLPYYIAGSGEWLESITALLESEGFDLVIPCDERTLIPLHLHAAQLSRLSPLAIPGAPAIDIYFDKHLTRELAHSLGIPVAFGRLIEPGDTAASLIAEAGLPLAVKPAQSYVASRLFSRNQVVIASDRQTLEEALLAARQTKYLFEVLFEGRGVGVSVLASKGAVLQAFEHWRVRELAGSSYYRVSAPASPALTDAVVKMVRAVDFTGIAMFEFRLNEANGTWVLLEVNARPWGSLPLPVALGVDFPYRWYQLLVEGVETPPVPYRLGVYGRNLLPDLRQVAARAKVLRGQPLRLAGFVARSVAEYGRVFIGREKNDVLVSDDPKPGLMEFKELFVEISDSVKLAVPGAIERRKGRDRRRLHRSIRNRKRGGAIIAIVCQGNICRSPFAAALLQRHLRSESHRIRVHSAGMLPRLGVPSPPTAIEAAKLVAVDMQNHRSQPLPREIAESATVFVVFDEINLLAIRDRFPFIAAPVVMLGSFLKKDGFPWMIADPDGGDLATFQTTYAQIAQAVERLAAEIRTALDAR
jgi:protein-tyrosine-phosphatase/predicted ATP-grasp superfamily ATP-dependent carboligase